MYETNMSCGGMVLNAAIARDSASAIKCLIIMLHHQRNAVSWQQTVGGCGVMQRREIILNINL